MSNTGRHRHVSIARRVALPSVIIAGAFVVAAVITGEVNLLRASSIAALSLGILVAALFDRELIRDRRAHGADRVNLARAYAVEYGGWIDERPVPDTAAELTGEDAVDAEHEVEPAADAETAVVAEAEAVVAEAAETEDIVEEPAEEPAEQPAENTESESDRPDGTEAAAAEAATADEAAGETAEVEAVPAEAEGVAEDEPAGVGDEPAEAAETTEAVEPAAVVDADEVAEPTEDGELWDDLAEAPTVVNLAMWEERAREPGQEQPSEDGDRKLA